MTHLIDISLLYILVSALRGLGTCNRITSFSLAMNEDKNSVWWCVLMWEKQWKTISYSYSTRVKCLSHLWFLEIVTSTIILFCLLHTGIYIIIMFNSCFLQDVVQWPAKVVLKILWCFSMINKLWQHLFLHCLNSTK